MKNAMVPRHNCGPMPQMPARLGGQLGGLEGPSTPYMIRGRYHTGDVPGIYQQRLVVGDGAITVDDAGVSAQSVNSDLPESIEGETRDKLITQLALVFNIVGSVPSAFDAASLKVQLLEQSDLIVTQGRNIQHVINGLTARITDFVQGGLEAPIEPNPSNYAATNFQLDLPDLPAAPTGESYTVTPALILNWVNRQAFYNFMTECGGLAKSAVPGFNGYQMSTQVHAIT